MPHSNNLCFLAEGKGHVPIELIQWITGLSAEPVPGEREHIGYAGIVLRTNAIQRAISELSRRGAAVIDDGNGGYFSYDPDGLLVQIIGGTPGIAGYVQNCSNIGQAIAYYVDLLGFCVESQGDGTADWFGGHRKEATLRITDAPADHPYLILRQWIDPPGVGGTPGRLDALGLVRVGLVSTDVPRDYKHITQEYDGLFGGPHDARVGNLPIHFAFVRGPDECFVELAEHNPGKAPRKG